MQPTGIALSLQSLRTPSSIENRLNNSDILTAQEVYLWK